jgi:hypothetical protein
MDVVEEHEGSRRKRERVQEDVWAVKELRASLEDRSSPTHILSKRFRQTPYVLVKTVSGNTIRVEPITDQEERVILLSDVKRSLSDDHGITLGSAVLLLNRQNVTNLDQLEIESGSTIYAVFRMDGYHETKPRFLDRSQC